MAFLRRPLAFVAGAVLLVSLSASPALAATYLANNTLTYRPIVISASDPNFPPGSCGLFMQHGNVYGVAYSKVKFGGTYSFCSEYGVELFYALGGGYGYVPFQDGSSSATFLQLVGPVYSSVLASRYSISPVGYNDLFYGEDFTIFP